MAVTWPPDWKVSREVPTGRSVVFQVALLDQTASNLDRVLRPVEAAAGEHAQPLDEGVLRLNRHAVAGNDEVGVAGAALLQGDGDRLGQRDVPRRAVRVARDRRGRHQRREGFADDGRIVFDEAQRQRLRLLEIRLRHEDFLLAAHHGCGRERQPPDPFFPAHSRYPVGTMRPARSAGH
jgi:hypothetical protein